MPYAGPPTLGISLAFFWQTCCRVRPTTTNAALAHVAGADLNFVVQCRTSDPGMSRRTIAILGEAQAHEISLLSTDTTTYLSTVQSS
jgi:hypothetical protein